MVSVEDRPKAYVVFVAQIDNRVSGLASSPQTSVGDIMSNNSLNWQKSYGMGVSLSNCFTGDRPQAELRMAGKNFG